MALWAATGAATIMSTTPTNCRLARNVGAIRCAAKTALAILAEAARSAWAGGSAPANLVTSRHGLGWCAGKTTPPARASEEHLLPSPAQGLEFPPKSAGAP